VRSDLAAGDSVHSNHFGGGGVRFGVKRRVMGAQWIEVVELLMVDSCERTQRVRLGGRHTVAGGWWQLRTTSEERGAWTDDVGATTY
jgi:hypothetical protein